MEKIKLIKQLNKIANLLDQSTLHPLADSLTNVMTKIAFDPTPNLNNLDFGDLDDTVRGIVVELDPDKKMGVADVENEMINFKYNPQKRYDILGTEKNQLLEIGDSVIIATPGAISVNQYVMMLITNDDANRQMDYGKK